LTIFIIAAKQNKLTNQKISSNYKVVREKKKIIKNDPNSIIKNYKEFIMELPNYNHTHMRSKKIFWCWLQGERNAPNISKACLNSVFRNCKSHEIILINLNNMNKYVHFPSFILQKLKKKCISMAHFSDLLRLELLIKYGGTWIDSTVLITKYNDIFFNNDLFFFQATRHIYHVGSNWFITAEKESPILRTTRDLLYEFWSKNDRIIHYFLFHFFFKMAYDRYYKEYRKIPYFLSNTAHKLQFELLKPFNKSKYKKILEDSSVHKLTRKRKTNLKKGLYYHYIIDNFN
jgi:hypothetical protein